MVKTFIDHVKPYSGYLQPAYVSPMIPDIDSMVGAAKNLKHLSAVSLTSEHLAGYIITNLPSYDNLYDLKLDGFSPHKLIWRNLPTSLRSLQWSIGKLKEGRNNSLADAAVDEASFLLKAIEETCPHLESLNISFTRDSKDLPTEVSPEIINEYLTLPATTAAKLTQLRHFGFDQRVQREQNQEDPAQAFVLEVVGRYSQSLRSIAILGSSYAWTRSQLDFVLKACAEIPNLLELKLLPDHGDHDTKLPSTAAWRELITSPATAKMERFSTKCIESSFSRKMGQLFSNWKNLKFLHVGDENIENGPFGEDGRPEFDLYRPHILAFIKNLPPTLQELYLEINGEGVCCEEDDDFDPLGYGYNTGTEIFNSLPRLHTCDLHAWISNVDMGLGSLPEKCVFFRRQSNSAATSPKEKIIWTSRMDQIYQDEDILVKKDSAVVTNESFEGDDAKEVWLDGLEFMKKTGGTQRGKPKGRPDQTWPFCKDLYQSKIGRYEMWRNPSLNF